MSLKLYVAGHRYGMRQWKFPTGEVGIKLDNGEEGTTDLLYEIEGNDCHVVLDWEGNDDLMALGQVVDALRKARAHNIDLNIPYFPYSRQDRRCHVGEGHALKVVAGYINSLSFNTVYTQDAHSDVLDTLVDRLVNSDIHTCSFRLPQHDIIVAPDAGAAKKLTNHAWLRRIHPSQLIVGEKVRDAQGSIVSLRIQNADCVTAKTVCILDDLADGAGTFLKVADALLPYQPAELDLYVTHGFFTRGFDELMKRFNKIYTHNLKTTVPEEYRERVITI